MSHLSEIIFTSFSFHVHETINHCFIANFFKFFLLHIANKSITQVLITIQVETFLDFLFLQSVNRERCIYEVGKAHSLNIFFSLSPFD